MLITQTSRFNIWRLYAHNSLRNYTYLVSLVANSDTFVIDPWDGEVVWDFSRAQNLNLKGVINTHSHHDHIRGNDFLKDRGVPIVKSCPFMTTLQLPGHTMDHVGFELKDDNKTHLFVGDTLFQAGVGNCKGGGEPAELFQTVQTLLKNYAHQETILYPGHDYLKKNLEFSQYVEPSNQEVREALKGLDPHKSFEASPPLLSEELKLNPFLRLHSTDLRQRLLSIRSELAKLTLSDEIVFKTLRLIRDEF
ncbi:MAG: MBL fold metallo-hydrolase [Bacteriovoracaceae bacterium]|nr:MBL fold metallo-hydrolase [Bacteriovoracaceae bacterium]